MIWAPTKTKFLWENQNPAKRFFDSLSKTRPYGAGFADTALLRREYEQREKKAEIPPSPKKGFTGEHGSLPRRDRGGAPAKTKFLWGKKQNPPPWGGFC